MIVIKLKKKMDPSLLASFSLKHDDFVHDVQFDFYGRRIATCSSDQSIRIWERTEDLQGLA
jgi:WD40 repeat protein